MREHFRSPLAALIAVFISAVLAVGCQQANEQPAMDTGEPGQDQPAQGVTGEQAGPAGETAAAPGDVVTAGLTEWAIELESDTVPPGPTTFRVVNRGDVVHAFEVEGNGMEWVTDRLQPGQETPLETDLEPGTYEVYCPVVGDRGDHSALGMTTTLVVEGT